MYDKFYHVITHSPLLILFITIAIGYFIGKFRVKTFVLGGIAGSLIIGVLIGQIGIVIPPSIGTIFFALFIYAVGYQGGPQFFRSLNKETGVQLISATITCVLGLLCVLAAAWIFHLDRGTAAGLAAGGLTQSAIIGTASDAIGQLGLAPYVTHAMQANVAVGYAVCYIFGSFGPIIILATLIPMFMKWNLRKEAKALAKKMSGSRKITLEPGQFEAVPDIDTRVYRVLAHADVIDKTAIGLFATEDGIAITALVRDAALINVQSDTRLQANDIVAVTTRTENFAKSYALFEKEVPRPEIMQLTEEVRDIVLTNKAIDGKTIGECCASKSADHYGLLVKSVSRLGEELKPHNNLLLKRGDDIKLVGRPVDLDRISAKLGHVISAAKVTDFISFCVGMALGVLIGMITIRIKGVALSMGTGGGCLVSGLLFGWLRSRHPQYGALPSGASNFLRDFGLAVFVATVGITAGPQAIIAIKHYGVELFLLGMGVTIIPQVLSFFISYYVLRIKNPIELLATIAGGRSANPGFAALLEKAGNATPVVAFTATYAVANIWLTLWGPTIVSLVTKNVH